MSLSKDLNYDNAASQNNLSHIMVNDIILPFLLGHSIDSIKGKFITPNDTYIILKDFQNCPIHDEPQNGHTGYQERAKKILIALGITDKNQQKKYLKKEECNNLYQLLCHLYRDEGKSIEPLIHLIDTAKPKSTLFSWLLPAAAVSLFVAIGAYLEKYSPTFYNGLMHAFKKIGRMAVSIAKHIANGIRALTLISMGYYLLIFLAEALNTALDNKRNFLTKAYDLSFALAATMLTLSSYTITFITYGTMTVTAGSIFIAASFVAVIKHSLSLYYAHENYKKYANKTPEEIADLSPIAQAKYYRKLYEYRAERMALIQEVSVACVSTLIIASWSLALLFPPGIILVAASLGALIAVQSLHSYTSTIVKENYSKELQEKLTSINGLEEAIENGCQNINDAVLGHASNFDEPGIELTYKQKEILENSLNAASTPNQSDEALEEAPGVQNTPVLTTNRFFSQAETKKVNNKKPSKEALLTDDNHIAPPKN